MLLPSAVVLLLLGSIQATEISEIPPANQYCHDPSVTAFSAAFYTALVFTNHDIVFNLQMPSKDASALLYKVLLDELNNFAVCNAVIVAKIVAKGVTFLPVFNLPDYFRLKGFTVGDYLMQQQILNCDNAVELALTYYKLVQGLLDGLDGTEIESYMRAISGGLLTWAEQQGLPLTEASHDLAWFFYDEFSKA